MIRIQFKICCNGYSKKKHDRSWYLITIEILQTNVTYISIYYKGWESIQISIRLSY